MMRQKTDSDRKNVMSLAALPEPSTPLRGQKTQEAERRIYDAVSGAIIARRLPPGTKLNEEQLAGVFGVSRARIRRVLLLLSESRLVTLQANRGAYVSKPSAKEAREVFAARGLIEREVARLFTALPLKARQSGAEALRRHIAQEQAAYNTNDRNQGIRLSGEFHQMLANLAGNAVLAGLLEQLISRSSLAIAAYERPGVQDCSFEGHAGLITALAEGDAHAAQTLMDAHIDHIQSHLTLDESAEVRLDLRAIFTAGVGF
jgi:DNA-binding GntR family transcriptional regulator